MPITFQRLSPVLLGLLLAVQLAHPAARPVAAGHTWYVAPAGNDGAGCSSPAAPCATLQAAVNLAAPGDTILAAAGTYTGAGSQVILVDRSLTLAGGWSSDFTTQTGLTALDGENTRRVAIVNAGVVAHLDRLILQNGYNPINSPVGTGLHNEGELTLSNSQITHNHGLSGVGGFANHGGVAILDHTTITDNMSGVLNQIGPNGIGELTLRNVSITHNSGAWGGLYNGPWAGSNIYITNSLIADNQGTLDAGGLTNAGSAIVIHNSSVVNNTSETGPGGIQNRGTVVTITTSLLAGNRSIQSTPNCYGAIVSGGFNIVSNTTGCGWASAAGDQLNVDPHAVSLGGGLVLLPDSPAIDHGDPAGCTDAHGAPLTTDQQDRPRPLDGDQDGNAICDVGSYEFDPVHPTQQSFFPAISNGPPGISGRVTVNGVPVGGVSLQLRFYDGAAWSTVTTLTTTRDGLFVIHYAPSLALGQKYYILYRNPTLAQGSLWMWATRELTAYTSYVPVVIGDFDIADVRLHSPSAYSVVGLPTTFQWVRRPATPSDSYEFNLFDPADGDPYFYTAPPLGYTNSFTLPGLPPDFLPNTPYAWEVWVYDPSGGFGISNQTWPVAFTGAGAATLTAEAALAWPPAPGPAGPAPSCAGGPSPRLDCATRRPAAP